MKKSMAASFALAVIVTGSAWAHHNMSAIFDLSRVFTETGTLTQLDWRNPHMSVSVRVESEEGRIETWMFEGPSPGRFREGDDRFGDVRRSDFDNSIGKTVTVEASPARDGSLSGLMREITLADGQVVAVCPC